MLHLSKAGLKPAGHKSGDDAVADEGFSMPDKPRLLDLLKGTPIFDGLEEEPLLVLIEHSNFRFHHPGHIIVQAGEAGNELFLILECLLRTESRAICNRTTLPPTLRPGDMFDSSASLLGSVHRSTIRAETQSLIYEIPSSALHALFKKFPDVMPKVAENLVISSNNQNDQMKNL